MLSSVLKKSIRLKVISKHHRCVNLDFFQSKVMKISNSRNDRFQSGHKVVLHVRRDEMTMLCSDSICSTADDFNDFDDFP